MRTRSRSAVFLLLAAAILAPLAPAQQKLLAPTPPMGWNSWDSYGLTITESQFQANVDVLAARLKSLGYQYAVVDEGWYLANPEAANHPQTLQYRIDANGRYLPATNRFASAAGTAGFQPLADYVHARGLKFGIHIIRGISKQAVAANLPVANSSFHAADLADTSDTCPWNPDNFGVKDNPAGQAWHDALFQQYAAWGIDYVKVDCIASHPYKGDEIRMIHRAIQRSGRPIVLSLSPGPAPLDKAAEVAANAQVWRISDDVWDRWLRPADQHFPQGVKNQFAIIASWSPQVRPGNWPDADMLPLGTLGPVPGYGQPRTSALTHDEQRTLITLWSIARSPLFMGGNLTQLDDWTAALISNPDVLAMDQQGHDQRLASPPPDPMDSPASDPSNDQSDGLIAWTSNGDHGRQYLALFNTTNSPMRFVVPLRRYGFTADKYSARDLWEHKDLGKIAEATAALPPHAVLLLELRH